MDKVLRIICKELTCTAWNREHHYGGPHCSYVLVLTDEGEEQVFTKAEYTTMTEEQENN